MHWFAALRHCFTAPKPCLAFFYKKSDPLTPVRSKYTFAPALCERWLSKCAALPGPGSALLPPGPALPREVPTLPRPSPALPPPGSASLCPDPALPCRGPALLRPRRALLSQGLALFRPGPALLGPRPCRSIQDQIQYNGLCIHIYIYICRMKEHAQSFRNNCKSLLVDNLACATFAQSYMMIRRRSKSQ